MSFMLYDLGFLVVFCLFITAFLYKNRKNLGREGIMYLYRTKLGIKLINYIGTKYPKTLGALKYFIIFLGYFLMAGILWLLGDGIYKYVRYPQITKLISAPPLAPVIPYFPKLFNMESFFPHFYFTYFLVAIAIVAIVHEFSHGIYMKYNNIKIKSTGIAFLGPILGAFVEQDDKDMEKAKKIDQMSILGAGVFANFVFAILFFFIWWLMFSVTFVPVGVTFDNYAFEPVNLNSIQSIDNFTLNHSTTQELISIINNDNFNKDILLQENEIYLHRIIANNKIYLIDSDSLRQQLTQNKSYINLYGDYPAIRVGLIGAITEIDGQKIGDYNDLIKVINELKPGQEITLKTNYNKNILEYNLTLVENPQDSTKPFFGIVNYPDNSLSFEDRMAFFKNPYTEYESKSDFAEFIYYLFFWIFLLNLLVAFFNMLPFSILDGGRFFYLTILGITKNKKISEFIYKTLGKVILFGLLLMMFFWVIRILF